MASTLLDLGGRNALVTGASSGLGRHFARTLAEHGAAVALVARREDALLELAAEIAGAGGQAVVIPGDISDTQSIDACVEAAASELGDLHILINNAGVATTGSALTYSEADWDRVIDTNLKGAWLMAQATARRMAEHGAGGSIINVASILGLGGLAGVPAYAASKGGLISLTRVLAVEWARHDIRVNALAPGYIETDLNRDFLAGPAGDKLKKRIPQRRFGQPRDLDGPLLLLASDASAHMTGSVLTIDGGHTAGL